MAITIDVTDHAAGKTIAVSGEVDMEASPGLKSRIQREVKSCDELRLNLSQVEYIDSSGVAVLIQGLKDAQAAGTAFVLYEPSRSVRDVLELAMLDKVFVIDDGGAS